MAAGVREACGLKMTLDISRVRPAGQVGIPFGGGDKHCGRALAALRIRSFRDGDEDEDGEHRDEEEMEAETNHVGDEAGVRGEEGRLRREGQC
jgi:hypothetical protein